MSAKNIVIDEYPQAVSVKNDDKLWSIMYGTKCIGQGKSEFSAWGNAKSHVLKKVMRRVYQKI